MSVAVARQPQIQGEPISGAYTLLELVQSVGEVTSSDQEVVATVIHMLRSGRVRLCGSFCNEPIELIAPPASQR